MSIIGNTVGSYSSLGKTLMLVDESGMELTGVIVDNLTVFDATAKDVKIGKTFASEAGVSVGTDTRTYRTCQKNYLIFPGESYSIPLEDYDRYDYTQLQCIVARFDTDIDNSVSTHKIVIGNNVYEVNSSTVLSTVTKNQETKSIDLNFTNNTEQTDVVYLFTYKEEE